MSRWLSETVGELVSETVSVSVNSWMDEYVSEPSSELALVSEPVSWYIRELVIQQVSKPVNAQGRM